MSWELLRTFVPCFFSDFAGGKSVFAGSYRIFSLTPKIPVSTGAGHRGPVTVKRVLKQALIRSIEDIGRFTSRLAKASRYLDFSVKTSGFWVEIGAIEW